MRAYNPSDTEYIRAPSCTENVSPHPQDLEIERILYNTRSSLRQPLISPLYREPVVEDGGCYVSPNVYFAEDVSYETRPREFSQPQTYPYR